MKTQMKLLSIGMLLSASLLTACQSNNKSADDGVVHTKDLQTSSELADAAEQLVTPYTFMLASKVNDAALEKDPTNLKALFYKKFLARTEVFRGIQYRIQPLLKTDSDRKNWLAQKDAMPDSALKTFLYVASKPQLKTVTDIQNVMGEYVASVRSFRDFLKQNNSSELVLNLNPVFFQARISEQSKNNCEVVGSDKADFDFKCDNSEAAKVRLNGADFIALSQISAGEMLYFGSFNNYSLEGVDTLNQPGQQLTLEQGLNKLFANQQFGKLRSDNTISMIKDIGADLGAATKWAMQYQKELCPKGDSEIIQRRGYLFERGFCISNTNEVQKGLSYLDQAMAGVMAIDVKNAHGTTDKINVDVFALSKNPIADLRSIAPTAYNSCGIASLADNSLGGVFVDKNLDVILKNNCNK